MKVIKDISRAVAEFWFIFLLGGILMTCGYNESSWFSYITGCFLIYIGISSASHFYKYQRKLEKWLVKNEGNILFFYPTKKKIQQRIQAEVLPLFEGDFLQAYYDGPNIVGDLEELYFLLKPVIFPNSAIRPNNPAIIQIRNGKFVVKDELKVLMNLADRNWEVDKEKLRKRIREACN